MDCVLLKSEMESIFYFDQCKYVSVILSMATKSKFETYLFHIKQHCIGNAIVPILLFLNYYGAMLSRTWKLT
jgi:hypothetical protein